MLTLAKFAVTQTRQNRTNSTRPRRRLLKVARLRVAASHWLLVQSCFGSRNVHASKAQLAACLQVATESSQQARKSLLSAFAPHMRATCKEKFDSRVARATQQSADQTKKRCQVRRKTKSANSKQRIAFADEQAKKVKIRIIQAN